MLTVRITHKKELSPADEGEFSTLVDSMEEASLNYDRENSVIEFSSRTRDECKISYLIGVIMRLVSDFGIAEINFYYKEETNE